MHILIIPSWYPKFNGDVGGSFFREQAIAIKKSGHQVGVIYPQIRSMLDIKGIFRKPYGFQIENDFGVETLKWHAINPFPKLPTLAKRNWINHGLRLFELYIKKNGKPDLIHVHSMLYAGYVAQLIQEKYGIPYVITEHSTAYARNMIQPNVIESLQPVINDAKECIAVSLEFTHLLNKLSDKKKWIYIPNIVNNDFFENDLTLCGNSKFTFINVCLLDYKKRVDLLIIAFAEAFKDNKDIHLKIGGDGPVLGELKKLCADLEMNSQISFLGMLSRKEVKQEIGSSNAFVLSSEYETFGVVLIEALALGKPIIATKCGGPESIVSREVGYLVEKNSVEQLKIALLELYNSRNRFSADSIRQYCFNNFSEERVIEKLNKIYIENGNVNE